MATRRMSGARLDHGAQFFTVRDSRFQEYVDDWLKRGLVHEWFRRMEADRDSEGHPRYCGVNGMTDVPKFLGEHLDVHRSKQVVAIIKSADLWSVSTADGERYLGKHLILTAPLPQAIALLDTTGLNWGGDDENALRSIRYEKGLATLAILDGASGLPAPGGMKLNSGPLTWIADNQQKGISPEVAAVTLHANAEFAEMHWDSPDPLRGQLMLDAAKPYLKADVLEFSCHRWGFTRPVNPWKAPYFLNSGLGLSMAGDAFGGERVEGAALSGLCLARQLIGA